MRVLVQVQRGHPLQHVPTGPLRQRLTTHHPYNRAYSSSISDYHLPLPRHWCLVPHPARPTGSNWTLTLCLPFLNKSFMQSAAALLANDSRQMKMLETSPQRINPNQNLSIPTAQCSYCHTSRTQSITQLICKRVRCSLNKVIRSASYEKARSKKSYLNQCLLISPFLPA